MESRARASWIRLIAIFLFATGAVGTGGGCAGAKRLSFVNPVSPVVPQDIAAAQESSRVESGPYASRPEAPLRAMFADTLVGFRSGTADSGRRYLGRLRDGYVVDTLNLVIMGDNRPSYRSTRLRPQTTAIRDIATLNPVNWVKGLINIPILLVKGTIPDFALWRDIPSLVRQSPDYGREESVVKAILARMDSLDARGQKLAAVINSGDLVKDGRIAEHWERFLRITRPLYDRVPYFPIAGNHERTDDPDGLANWHTATGLPIRGNLLHYCFDSADGWVRFIGLDSNPMVDQYSVWSREDEVAAVEEQFDWMTRRLKEHNGPAMVFLHHPPFCLGFHRDEWQADSLLYARRQAMVQTLRDAGIGVLVAGHEHAYERALLTCGDAVLICIVTGGAGSPLHTIPTGEEAGRLFAEYQVPGCSFKPENVMADMVFNYVHMRLWFGGGEFFTYAVDQHGNDTLIDHVQIDLKRYGVPKVDQDKMPLPPAEGPKQPPPPEEAGDKPIASSSSDSTKAVKPVPAATGGTPGNRR